MRNFYKFWFIFIWNYFAKKLKTTNQFYIKYKSHFKYKNFRSLGTEVILHWILYGYEVRYFPWKWLFHFWIHKLRCCLILSLRQTTKTFNLPIERTADKNFFIGINRIQVTCCRSQFSNLRPLLIFEHCFVQVRILTTNKWI